MEDNTVSRTVRVRPNRVVRAAEAKPWKCTQHKEHILGVTYRNGSGVEQLLLYRNAICLERTPLEEIDVIAVVEGLTLDVRCSICGAFRTWVPGEEAIRRMLKKMGR